MLREQVRPVNAVDAAIAEALRQREREPLTPVRESIDSATLETLGKLLDDPDEIEPWERLARALDSAGLDAAALTAYERLAGLARGLDITDWRRRAPYYTRMAEIERRRNMVWAAATHDRVVNRLMGRDNAGGGGMLELEEGDLYVVTAHLDPAEFSRLTTALPDHPLRHDPLRDPTFTKQNSLAPPPSGDAASDDCSFLVLDGDGRPVVLVEADAMGDRHLGCRETAILFTRLANDHPRIEAAADLAVRQVRIALEWSGCNYLMVERGQNEPLPSLLRAWIAQVDPNPIRMTSAWVDLSESEEAIERNYREAHRQSLRWGRRNIRIERTDHPTPRLVADYVHIHRAGHRTPAVTAPTLEKYLLAGRMTLYIGYFEDRPVVALLSSRHGDTTYYWASAKLPVGNKPIGHVVLHQAIMDARAEGKRRFYFGLLDTHGNYSEKTRSIALYKRGFANRTEDIIHYGLRL
ncbi:GNAT family N-acetyltransferase [Magnetospirillum sp. SS-4]|uniref:GNAT family N-acetyltransferase n=1 Tax=Magnetospirillum sp. SS-4 TaxID=2681465 RepID=UPI0013862127|nr:GNAT family N-acetyltransferase [Magnetospirillum sp. SS-4]CAA7623424.1 hypothetical protein MTBSS4_40227 [Magnetospirillum sp. SS-4]